MTTSNDQPGGPALAIWDVDGTLVDSRAVIGHAMDVAFTSCGLTAPGYARTRHIVGLSLHDACRDLARDLAPAGLPEADLEALVEAYKHAFIAHRADPIHEEPLYEGAMELVETLRGGGWTLAIATGKARRGVDAFFKAHPGMARAFASVHCADDGPGKPHPHMVRAALSAHGAETGAAVMIGDTRHDIAMAQAAGVYAMGVTWGFHTADEITEAGADEVHHTMASLAGGLAEFGARTR